MPPPSPVLRLSECGAGDGQRVGSEIQSATPGADVPGEHAALDGRRRGERERLIGPPNESDAAAGLERRIVGYCRVAERERAGRVAEQDGATVPARRRILPQSAR